MSCMPSTDPVLGRAPSCYALEMMVVLVSVTFGRFSVRRVLPHEQTNRLVLLSFSTISVLFSSTQGRAWTCDLKLKLAPARGVGVESDDCPAALYEVAGDGPRPWSLAQ